MTEEHLFALFAAAVGLLDSVLGEELPFRGWLVSHAARVLQAPMRSVDES